MGTLTLSFAVARDEEYVRLKAVYDDRELDLGARGHNFLLLTLARRRLADIDAHVPADSCGWFYVDDFARGLLTTRMQLNLDVFRIRKAFVKRGVLDGDGIIERRGTTGQIRIGTDRLVIAGI
jgi:hypothetical protein